jgi:polyisoprenyl-teichoic acid--peptidoglycan teichoic acid transferase
MINEIEDTKESGGIKITIKKNSAPKTLIENNQPAPLANKPKKKRKRKFLAFLIIFLCVAGFVFSSQVLISNQSGNSWFYNIPLIKQMKTLAESANRGLKGEDRGRINILLLGIGGKNHDGGLLTDTIMVASIDTENKKLALTSIPRDLSVPVENMGWRKINSINAYAEAEKPGSGGLAISQAVSDLFSIPIDYYVRIDFQGFINIIDELGGVDVFVENTLDDYNYPVLGNEDAEWDTRYEHLHVEKGWQKMDGSLALKFARSRHGINGEGSDFARASRQQKIITAVKNKVLSMNTLLNPSKITGIINELQEHVSTNIQIWEMLKMWDMVKDIDRDHIITKVIDNSANGLLIDAVSEDGAYLLKPRSGDFTEIQYFINNVFADAPVEDKSKVAKEVATVEVRNGTWVNGLASQAALDLEKYGFIVVRIGNSSKQNFEKSVIYDLTYGEKIESLTVLKNKMDANVAYSLPEWLVTDISNETKLDTNPVKPDFILILGRSADQTQSGAQNPENQNE